MSIDVMKKAVELLLTSEAKRCQLRFWGGEPLLRWEFVREGIRFAEAKAKEKNKDIRFMINTNGLLLDQRKIDFFKQHPVEFMFSIDGDKAANEKCRCLSNHKSYYGRLLKNLKRLIDSGLSYFVNMVVTPATAKALFNNIRFLMCLGVKKIQLCYYNGIIWPEDKKKELLEELGKFVSSQLDCAVLMNFVNACEPTMLSQEIVADVDGKVYFDAAIFMEKVFPGLRKAQYIGRLGELDSIDRLYLSRKALYKKFTSACGKKQKDILENNIDLGLALDGFFSSFSYSSLKHNEHPLLIPLIKSDIERQSGILSKFGLNSAFLYVDGPCVNDCIFCKRKEDQRFSDMFNLEAKIKKNMKMKVEKLCLIGNEPLFHPEITEIVRSASKFGFRKIEIMTSGNLLSDKVFCAKLIKAGVRSFSFPLFAAKEDIHDFIVGRQGAFYGVTRAIKNILSLRGEVFIHTNLLRQNIDHLKDLENFVEKQLSLPFVILPVRPKSAPMEFREIMPSYDEVIKKLKGINSLVGFPLCVVKHVQKDLLKSGKEISDSMKLYFLDQKFSKLRTCVGCRQYNKCSGFAKEYVEDYSDDFISPFN